jgi:hypothetical protein
MLEVMSRPGVPAKATVSGCGFAIVRPPTEHANPLMGSIINWTVTTPGLLSRARAPALSLLPAYFSLSPELDTGD